MQEFIFASWRRTCRKYGFESYEGPMFESLDLFTQKSGPEIERQLYAFQDRAGRNIALRPEMTPTLARMVAARGNNCKCPYDGSPSRAFSGTKRCRGPSARIFPTEYGYPGRCRGFRRRGTHRGGHRHDVRPWVYGRGFQGAHLQPYPPRRAIYCSGFMPDRCEPLFALLDKKSKIPEGVFAEELAGIVPQDGSAMPLPRSLGSNH